MADSSSTSDIRVLLSFKNAALKSQIKAIFEKNYPHSQQLKLSEIDLLQDVMELLEKGGSSFHLILFEHNSSSTSLVKAMLELEKSVVFVMCSNEVSTFDGVRTLPEPPEMILSAEIEASLQKLLKKLATIGKIPALPSADEDHYSPMNEAALLAMKPLRYDVYLKMTQGKMVRIFPKGVTLETADLQKYSKNKADSEIFYIKKTDAAEYLKEQAERINKLSNQSAPSPSEVKKEYQASIASVRDVVSTVGFTPEAQMMAKSCVAMAIKALGSKPELSMILQDLKKKEGDYIVSHSFMVGQVACALAHKIGWSSAATFLKLSLAGFLHDISLNPAEAEYEESYEKAEESHKLTAKQLHQLKLHPMQGAEYSRQFTEIPSDVDQILAQHHERPDGSGYPRCMHGKLISPLSALFIMSHDLVCEVNQNPSTNIDQFFEARENDYQIGHFKKIILALKSAGQGSSLKL